MPKRMLKGERREQLLSIAVSILKEDGAEGLTLATVAEKAGVTKPIAYNHFSSKENLLKQIYQGIDQRLIESIQVAKDNNNLSLEETVSILCDSYVNCMRKNGEIYDITLSALKCYPENAGLQEEVLEFFVNSYSEIFQLPVLKDDHSNRMKLVSVYGIIEAVGEAIVTETIPSDIGLPYLKTQVYKLITD
ncbi:TetR/AcrR family transcriptional regulator [Vibrio sp. HN007]|uniref:TetR/AcrR family transcriptional regulator n=1 Tax=Vibrio iocasae TaxID=3098914 RepID=UPI0035D3ED2D